MTRRLGIFAQSFVTKKTLGQEFLNLNYGKNLKSQNISL